MANKKIEDEIATIYPPDKELQILKAYTDWISNGEPANDPRYEEYKTMERTIKRIETKYRQLK